MNSQCRVCDEYGCTAGNHQRCSFCNVRGHTKRTCKAQDKPTSADSAPDSTASVNDSSQFPFPLRRDTTKSLTQVNQLIFLSLFLCF